MITFEDSSKSSIKLLQSLTIGWCSQGPVLNRQILFRQVLVTEIMFRFLHIISAILVYIFAMLYIHI